MTNFLQYLNSRQQGFEKKRFDDIFLKKKWAEKQDLYKKDLLAHFGCVNAVEFSEDGELLATGGDDKRVLCWNLDQAVFSHEAAGAGFKNNYKPAVMSAEHESNIFCISFDNAKSQVYSGGNDAIVIVHDLETLKPVDVFKHEEPVYGVSVHPADKNLFLTACSDGRVLLHDMRQRSGVDPIMIAGYSYAFHAVQFNPVEPRLLVAANQKHGIGLWDVRKPEKVVLEYGAMGGRHQSCMYVRWNLLGDMILGLRRRLSPVLYHVSNPSAVAQFDHPGYYNSCTMKNCSFAGPNDEYVMSGSDDFNVYMWKVPQEGETQPQWVPRAHHVLQGHRSIVNQVRYNHSRSIIATSGVEKVVKLWSALPFPTTKSNATGNDSQRGERRVFSHDEYIGLVMRSSVMTHDYSAGSTAENPRMMAFFDSLVQREIEGRDSDDSDNSEGDNDGSEDYFDTVHSDDEEDTGTVNYTRRERTEINEIGNTSNNSSNSVSAENNESLNTSSELDSSLRQEAETQTPRQSSQNIIADLIAKKRGQLLRKSRRRDNSFLEDEDQVNKILRTAKRTLRTESQDTEESSSDSGSSLLSLSSILRKGERSSDDEVPNTEENLQDLLPGPSTGPSAKIKSLQEKKRKLLTNKDDDSTDTEENYTANPNQSSIVSFKKNVKLKKRNVRKRSSASSSSN